MAGRAGRGTRRASPVAAAPGIATREVRRIYNLALGDRRANSVAGYLVDLGFARERLRTVTYGRERPQCADSQESCWWRNRRAHFRILSKGGQGPDH
jgi:flagellar motor protein MotB